MPDLINRPQLPEIFPQEDVTVDGERHTFNVSETDLGTQSQLEYTLDKAPIKLIDSVQGTDQNGNTRTFSNGVDYELTSKTDNVTETFTYRGDDERLTYALTYEVDAGTDVVSDDSGDTYVNGTDYQIINGQDYPGDVLEWIEDGSAPDTDEQFSIVYDVTFPSSVLQWQTDGNNLPEANTEFYVTYRTESIISRYLDAHENELDGVEDQIQEIINNKFIDSASGDALDELGKLFGDTIGKRRGRDDTAYRTYLKSIVQSFISRGTVNGIKLAISAATDIPLEDITINEDFTDVSYEVEFPPNTVVNINLLEEVAEIADPSGVDQSRTALALKEDEVEINDDLSITEGTVSADEAAADDTVIVDANKFTVADQSAADDNIFVDPNKFTVADQSAGDDAAFVDPNTTTTADLQSSDDQITRVEEKGSNLFEWASVEEPTGDTWGNASWDSAEWVTFEETVVGDNWNFMEWSAISALGTLVIAEVQGVADAGDIEPRDNDSFRWTENLNTSEVTTDFGGSSFGTETFDSGERSEDRWNFMEWTA